MAVQPRIEWIPVKKDQSNEYEELPGLMVKCKVTSCNGPLVKSKVTVEPYPKRVHKYLTF